jgi:hypothetical protein
MVWEQRHKINGGLFCHPSFPYFAHVHSRTSLDGRDPLAGCYLLASCLASEPEDGGDNFQ